MRGPTGAAGRPVAQFVKGQTVAWLARPLVRAPELGLEPGPGPGPGPGLEPEPEPGPGAERGPPRAPGLAPAVVSASRSLRIQPGQPRVAR